MTRHTNNFFQKIFKLSRNIRGPPVEKRWFRVLRIYKSGNERVSYPQHLWSVVTAASVFCLVFRHTFYNW